MKTEQTESHAQELVDDIINDGIKEPTDDELDELDDLLDIITPIEEVVVEAVVEKREYTTDDLIGLAEIDYAKRAFVAGYTRAGLAEVGVTRAGPRNKIAYPDVVTGELTTACRYRAYGNAPFKYKQEDHEFYVKDRVNSKALLYFPDHKDRLNTEVTIYGAEGEFKALTMLNRFDVPVYGIGGKDCIGFEVLLPIPLNARKSVYLVDSDIDPKKETAAKQSACRLMRQQLLLGAEAYIISTLDLLVQLLPYDAGGYKARLATAKKLLATHKKLAIDDLIGLVTIDKAKFVKAVNTAIAVTSKKKSHPNYALSLTHLQGQLVYVGNGAEAVFNAAHCKRLRPSAIVEMCTGRPDVQHVVIKSAIDPTTKLPVLVPEITYINQNLKIKKDGELERFAMITIDPKESKIFYNSDKQLCYNIWNGFETKPYKNQLLVALYLQEVSRILNNDPEANADFHNFICFLIRYPWIKQFRFPIFKGLSGTGKSFLWETLARLINGKYTKGTGHYGVPLHADVFGPTELAQRFNQGSAALIFAVGNELNEKGAGDPNHLKSLITNPLRRIENKGVESYKIPNVMHAAATTNENYTHSTSSDARRDWVESVTNNKMNTAYWNKMHSLFHFNWSEPATYKVESWRSGHGGTEAVMHYYMYDHDLGDYAPTEPARYNAAKEDFVVSSKGDLGTYVMEKLTDCVIIKYEVDLLAAYLAARGMPVGANLRRRLTETLESLAWVTYNDNCLFKVGKQVQRVASGKHTAFKEIVYTKMGSTLTVSEVISSCTKRYGALL